MALEIERKFLVEEAAWAAVEKGRGVTVRQGYLPQKGDLLVRIRRQNDRAFLTLKGRTTGVTRAEFEYEIPAEDAAALLAYCERPLIEKTRYLVPFEGFTWEVDVFSGDNEGLLLAEIELPAEDTPFRIPAWVGAEVSGDARYYNSNLIAHPYTSW